MTVLVYIRCILLLSFVTPVVFAQASQSPATLAPEPFILLDSVVTEQWPAMLPSVNIPAQPTVLNPGQCVRIGVAAAGSGFEHFLDGITIHAVVSGNPISSELPSQSAAASKLIRPEGSDAAEAALAAAGLKNPFPISGVLAVSRDKWCVAATAHDGSASFAVDVDLHGKRTALNNRSIPIQSVNSATAFTTEQQLSDWIMAYDRYPTPARLPAAIAFLSSSGKDDPNVYQFFVSAFAHDAATARLLGPSIAKLPKHAELLALAIAARAGVTLDQPPDLSREDQNVVTSLITLPDAYDMSSGQTWKNLDLLWSEFLATGTRKPVVAVAQTLEWSSDYDGLLQLKAQGKIPPQLTPSLIHGLTFGAARWSLSSFQRTDPLAADYIRALRETTSLTPAIRQELGTLNTPSPGNSSH